MSERFGAEEVAIGSVVVGLAVLALKFWAYALTGSMALYSDALESGINVAAALAALAAIRTARKPADENHPFGHHKAEYLSAVLEGVLIVLAALAILFAAVDALRVGARPANLGVGILVNALAGLLNGGWCVIVFRAARRYRSPALKADARHLLADVVTSIGVLGGLGLAGLTGLWVLDPILAVVVAGSILWSGWRLLRESVGGLMDEAASPEAIERIRAILLEHGGGAIQVHDLRTRIAGPVTFVEYHLVVPARMTVQEAHVICDRMEAALRHELGRAHIAVHVEPAEKAKHGADLVF